MIDTQTDTHTGTQTDAGDDNTRRPKLTSGKNVKFVNDNNRYELFHVSTTIDPKEHLIQVYKLMSNLV